MESNKLERRFPSDTRRTYPVGASDYQLLEEVGRGVSAVVYRAKCLPFSEYVAIKALDLDRCNSNLDDIRREAQTMSLINHPNVIKAYCSFVVERSLWVVMPYMAGGSCLHIMKSAYPDGFEEPIIASFLKETLKALEYLHHQGHIHRDVKAGNILVDSNGIIKLGDFGVSACMFETGDRQRSRNTFVGTPCWMAPEVMEQSHGYDFKADIWSFGITALELAHGHAPFSKYPPMKVLLMTLQNAPPGLDYERDKRFSKAFKEMIAMCLVKDPKKRPTAEKLLKHFFFKHARPAEYVARAVIATLPPLWERINDLKVKEAARLAQKKVPYDEQEERSQNEYKRGVSSWNFDLEVLKAEAALNEIESFSEKKDAEGPEMDQSSLLPPRPSCTDDFETIQQLGTSCSIKAEDENIGGEQVKEVQARILSTTNASKLEDTVARKQGPKHYGRFDVFEADPDQENIASCVMSQSKNNEISEGKEFIPGINAGERMEIEGTGTENAKESKVELKSGDFRRHKEDEPSQVFSRADSNDMREDSESHAARKAFENSVRTPRLGKTTSFNGITHSSNSTMDVSLFNGVSGFSRPNGQKDDDKLKVPLIQRKGRFSVTAHDMEFQEGLPSLNLRRNAGIQSSLHKSASVSDGLVEQRSLTGSSLSSQSSPAFSNAAIILPQLQNLFNQTMIQQELIISLMSSINTSEQHSEKITAYRSNGFGSKSFGCSNTINSGNSMGELLSDKERELIAQIADLQNRVTTVFDELQAARSRNVQLERQLNAIHNKGEELRTEREDAISYDG